MANKVDIVTTNTDDVNLDPIKKKYDKFSSSLVSDMKAAGLKAGDGFGNSIAIGIEKASLRVLRANKAQSDSVRRVKDAQAELTRVMMDAASTDEEVAVAKANLKSSLDNLTIAAKAARIAQRELNEEQRKSAEIANEANQTTVGPQFDFTSGISRSKALLISEMKSAGITAGVSFAGGIAAGLSPAAMSGIFVGLAAAAQSGNQQIRAKYQDLWEQVKAGAQDASSDLADEFIGLAEQLGRTFNSIKPELEEAMDASQPAIRDFGDGIDRLAKTSMPGMVNAAKASSQATDDVADAMESAGRGVSNFFNESVEGAAAGGEAFAAFGRIVERMGTFAGRIIADLANSSTMVFPALENTVDAAADAIENLATTALPSLAGGASLGLSALTLLLNLANGLISVLGPLAPAIMSIATSLKLLDMVSFGGVKGRWDSFMGSIRAADGPMGKAKAGLSGILTTLGPVGLAAGALTLGLSFLADQQAKAAERAAKHRDAIKTLAGEFERTGGTVDGAIRKMVGERVINDFGRAKDAMRDAGVGLDEFVNAAVKSGTAYDDMHRRLTAIIEAGKELRSDPGTGAMSEEYSKEAAAALEVLKALEALGGETDAAHQRQRELADAMSAASGRANTLAEEFETLADKAASAEDKADALYQVMRRMAGGAPDIEAATKKWEELIDSFNTKEMNFEDKTAGTKKWADALVDAQGKINLTTEDGRKLYETATDMSLAFQETATSMKANGDSADAIRARLQTMRDQFIDLAMRLGFSADQAKKMADHVGLIPDSASVVVTSNLAPEIQKAIDLGGRIQALPDGNFVVHTNTRNAQGSIDSFIQRNDGRVIHITTTASGVSTNRTFGGRAWQAAGGLGSFAGLSAATGGARTGAIMTNERGQESITLPDRTQMAIPITAPVGSQVHPHDGNTFLNGQSGPIIPIFAGFDPGVSSNDVIEAFGLIMRKFIKFRGGDPVKALGQ